MRKRLALLTIMGLLLFGLAAPAGADSDARPFKATVVGTVSWTPDAECPPTLLSTDSAGVGNATHLGKMAMASEHCTPPGLDYGPGFMVFTAASGDELHFEYGGTCPPFMDLPIGDLLTCTVDWDVVGGTGRFAYAQGSGSGYVSIVWEGLIVPTMDAWWTLEGTIGY